MDLSSTPNANTRNRYHAFRRPYPFQPALQHHGMPVTTSMQGWSDVRTSFRRVPMASLHHQPTAQTDSTTQQRGEWEGRATHRQSVAQTPQLAGDSIENTLRLRFSLHRRREASGESSSPTRRYGCRHLDLHFDALEAVGTRQTRKQHVMYAPFRFFRLHLFPFRGGFIILHTHQSRAKARRAKTGLGHISHPIPQQRAVKRPAHGNPEIIT